MLKIDLVDLKTMETLDRILKDEKQVPTNIPVERLFFFFNIKENKTECLVIDPV